MVFAILTLALQALAPASAAPTYTSPAIISGGPAVVAAACTVPNSDARVVTAAPPEIPHSVAPLRGSVDVLVKMAPSGHVSKAIVEHSSGNQQVDATALNAAKASTYSPAQKNCRPVDGKYIFHVQFNPHG